uniref:Uncharacterized protein n=1 Tax=Nelumbo nucifera TaxID=4432 RepID=A0A822ZCY8_NELNU|nr:TPA_asm: hypothetical protein HUJ06_001232 [Nelumbo nucifera]
MDTGSDFFWTQCLPCERCCNHLASSLYPALILQAATVMTKASVTMNITPPIWRHIPVGNTVVGSGYNSITFPGRDTGVLGLPVYNSSLISQMMFTIEPKFYCFGNCSNPT